MVSLDLSLLWVRRLASSGLIERTETISASLVGAIVGLGIGLLEGHHLRKTAPVASRAESELLVVWGMAGVILGLIMFEILFIGFYAFNTNPFFGRLSHYPYPTFLLLRFYYLCLGSHLGLSLMMRVVKQGSARPSPMSPFRGFAGSTDTMWPFRPDDPAKPGANPN